MKTKFLAFISSLVLAGSVHAGLIAGPQQLETPILGGSILVATNGNVRAEFLGSYAGYFNILYLNTASSWGPGPIFHKYTPQHALVDLGYFTAGTELVFRLFVTDRQLNYFSGDAYRNPDRLAHVRAVTSLTGNGTYLTTIGFEDVLGGGDRDYNDFNFSLTNTIDPPPQVPEPSILMLLTVGAVGLLTARRRRRT